MGEESAANRFRFASEMDRIFESEEFSRSPVMRRLLRFLIDQTLAGNGDQLKAYSVAVDGLGRDPDFDAQTDSYPRVQIGRLRRMLDAHYARNGFPSGERLIIPNGAYRVYLHPVYPRAERHAKTEAPDDHPQGEDAPPPSPPVQAYQPKQPQPTAAKAPDRRNPRPAFLVALAALALLMLLLLYRGFGEALLGGGEQSITRPPEMLLLPVERGVNSSASLASSVDQALGDALHRSWVVNVHSMDRPKSGKPEQQISTDHAYRLQSVLAGPNGDELYLTLWNARTGDRIWTDHLALAGREGALAEVLRLPAANLIGSFGIIAAQERQHHAAAMQPGYVCLLKNADYRLWYSEQILQKSRKCLDQTLALENGASPLILAASAIVNSRLSRFRPQEAFRLMARAEIQARQALLLDPYSPEANMVSATLAMKNGRCLLAKDLGLRALELNPYEPEYYARVGMILFQCNDPDHEKYLVVARQMNPQLPAFFSVPVIAAMSERGEKRAALGLALSLPTAVPDQMPLYSITLALAYGQNGDSRRAARHWNDLSATPANVGRTPYEILKGVLANPNLARRTGELLVKAGVISNLNQPDGNKLMTARMK